MTDADYYSRNRDTILAKKRRRYSENRERLLANHTALRTRNGVQWNANRKAKNKENPAPNLINVARSRAKRKGIEFRIGVADITVPDRCPVFGTVLVVGDGGVSKNSPTIDRIDNSKGYVPGNVVVVSFRANTIKSDATVSDLRRVADFYEGLGA